MGGVEAGGGVVNVKLGMLVPMEYENHLHFIYFPNYENCHTRSYIRNMKNIYPFIYFSIICDPFIY